MFICYLQACNLKAAQTKQQFMYINALSTPYDWSAPSTSSAPAVAATPGLDSWSLGENEDAAFKSLYHKVKAFAESSEAMDEVCIVIDNLSVLLETCQRPALVLDLVHYLQAFIRRTEVARLLSSYSSRLGEECPQCVCAVCAMCAVCVCVKQNRASLVVLVHGDVEDDQKLVKALEHRADIIMSASGLPSGYSKEVNGQVPHTHTQPHTHTYNRTRTRITVSSFSLDCHTSTDATLRVQLLVHGNGVPQSKLMHFKSHDNTVRFMSK
jgi:hypothetical protein